MTIKPQQMANLREKGYRLTPQRLAILDILDHNVGHLSPLEIYQHASQRLPGITETTVYRTLDFLANHGLAVAAHMGEGKLGYESSVRQHHHLICRNCGYSIEIAPIFLEALTNQFKEQTGFMIDCSHLTFLGLCPDCVQKM